MKIDTDFNQTNASQFRGTEFLEKFFIISLQIDFKLEFPNIYRFMLTRNLIILQQIIQRCGFPDEVSDGTTEMIHSTFLPTYVVLNLSYFILTWITETNATAPPSDSLEQGLRQMAVLKISSRGQNSGM